MDEQFVMERIELNPVRANVYSAVFALVVLVAAMMLYGGEVAFTIQIVDVFFFMMLLVGGIFVHEALHGIGFWLFGKTPWSSLSFGIKWRKLIVYACCTKPIGINAYRGAALLPAIVLGFFPFVLSLYAQSLMWYFWSALMIVGSFGDFYLFWTLRRYEKQTMISDSLDHIGYYAYRPGA